MSKLLPNINRGSKVPYTNADIRDVTTPEGVSQLNDELRRISTAVKEVANSNSPLANDLPQATSEPATQVGDNTSATATSSGNIPPLPESKEWALTIRDTHQFAALPKKVQSLNLISSNVVTSGLTRRNVKFEITKGSLANNLKTIPDAEEVNVQAYVEVDESGSVIVNNGNNDLTCLKSKVAALALQCNCDKCRKVGKLDTITNVPYNPGISDVIPPESLFLFKFGNKVLHIDGLQKNNVFFFKAPKNGTYQISSYIKWLTTAIWAATAPADPFVDGSIVRLFLTKSMTPIIELDMQMPPHYIASGFGGDEGTQYIYLQGTTVVPMVKGETLGLGVKFTLGKGVISAATTVNQKAYGYVDVIDVSDQDTKINDYDTLIVTGV